MSERVKELLEKARKVHGWPFHETLESIEVLAAEVDTLARGLKTMQGHVHAPPPSAQPPIMIDASRAIALASIVRDFLGERVSRNALRDALSNFDAGPVRVPTAQPPLVGITAAEADLKARRLDSILAVHREVIEALNAAGPKIADIASKDLAHAVTALVKQRDEMGVIAGKVAKLEKDVETWRTAAEHALAELEGVKKERDEALARESGAMVAIKNALQAILEGRTP